MIILIILILVLLILDVVLWQLFNRTSERLIKLQSDVINDLIEENKKLKKEA